MRVSPLVLPSLLVLALVSACDKKPEVDPAEAAAKLRADLDTANTRLRNNKNKDAEQLYDKILQQQADQHEALAGMARIRSADGNVEEALVLIDKAIAAKPDDAPNHSLRGELLAKLGRHADAAAAYGKAFELAPDKSEYGLPQGIELKLAEKYDEAEVVLRKVAEVDPQAKFVHTELADVLRAQKRLDESLKMYMKALRTYASDKMAHAGAAQVYEANGDLKHALDEWSAYVRMDCCSPYSETVARKKIGELQSKSSVENGGIAGQISSTPVAPPTGAGAPPPKAG